MAVGGREVAPHPHGTLAGRPEDQNQRRYLAKKVMRFFEFRRGQPGLALVLAPEPTEDLVSRVKSVSEFDGPGEIRIGGQDPIGDRDTGGEAMAD